MTGVFELIFYLIESVYYILKEDFIISVWGFSFSLWDFLLSLFLLSFIVPLVVAPDHTGTFFNLSRSFSRNSERNDNSLSQPRSSFVNVTSSEHRNKVFSSSSNSYSWHTRK